MDSAEAAACLRRIREGDEGAARDLFHFLYPLVARLVRSHLPQRTSEEDLCQIAMVKIPEATTPPKIESRATSGSVWKYCGSY